MQKATDRFKHRLDGDFVSDESDASDDGVEQRQQKILQFRIFSAFRGLKRTISKCRIIALAQCPCPVRGPPFVMKFLESLEAVLIEFLGELRTVEAPVASTSGALKNVYQLDGSTNLLQIERRCRNNQISLFIFRTETKSTPK